MRAVCLVGICQRLVIAEAESRSEVELRAEEHRRVFHEWVKPGRCHEVLSEEAEGAEVG